MIGDLLRMAASLALLAAAVALLVAGMRDVKRAIAEARQQIVTARRNLDAARRQRTDTPHARLIGRQFIENLVASRIVVHGADAEVDLTLNADLYAAAWAVYEAHSLPNPWIGQGIHAGLVVLTDTLVRLAVTSPYPDPAPTLGDLLVKVRAASLDDPLSIHEPATLPAGATR